ncbi:MAG: YCF48-related protein, partial [Bacteroidales bacterium]|nr:YCF48-related protein [Bacteroidales bacterium]
MNTRFKNFWMVLMTVFFGLSMQAQQWELLNPSPTFNDIQAVSFPSPDTGFIVGNNSMVMRTFDGGESWTNIDFPAEGVQIRFVDFRDNNHGVVVAWSHIFTTSDAGESWHYTHWQQAGDYVAADFVDNNTGWITGSGSILIKTSDGGINWNRQSIPSIHGQAIDFVNENVGFVAGHLNQNYSYPRLYKTLDGGESWTTVSLPERFERFGGLSVINEQQIWIAAHNHSVNHDSTFAVFKAYYTNNGGANWTIFEIGQTDGSMIRKMKFITAEEGYIMSYGQLYRTFNGGENWEAIPIETGFISSCTDFSWQGGEALHVAGTGPFLMKSEDSGQSWENLVDGMINDFKSVYFLNEQQGFVGYGGIEGPTILRTTDGGLNWHHVNGPDFFAYAPVSSFAFASESKGWAAFTNNQIFETNDGGLNWQLKQTGFDNYYFNHITVSADGGLFLTSTRGEIIKSTDDGNTWTDISPSLADDVFFDGSTNFVSQILGFMALRTEEYKGLLLKTSDGGVSWHFVQIPFDERVSSISFADSETGMITLNEQGVLITNDGGETWSEPLQINDRAPSYVKMITPLRAVATFEDAMAAITTDGGESWELRYEGQLRRVSYPVSFFLDEMQGWLVGVNGAVLRYTDEFLSVPSNMAYEQQRLFYPNPAKEAIFLLPENHNGLSIYDMQG